MCCARLPSFSGVATEDGLLSSLATDGVVSSKHVGDSCFIFVSVGFFGAGGARVFLVGAEAMSPTIGVLLAVDRDGLFRFLFVG